MNSLQRREVALRTDVLTLLAELYDCRNAKKCIVQAQRSSAYKNALQKLADAEREIRVKKKKHVAKRVKSSKWDAVKIKKRKR